METKTILVLAAVLVAAFALYFIFTHRTPSNNQIPPSPALSLILRSMAFGSNSTQYLYSFSQVTNSYLTNYTIIVTPSGNFLQVDNPISSKQFYFLPNDTVFCMSYFSPTSCTSIKNDSRMLRYAASFNYLLPSSSGSAAEQSDFIYLTNQGYAKINPNLSATSSGNCVDYTIDYSNITPGDAIRFGINANSSRFIYASLCADSTTGYYQRSFNYSLNGTNYRSSFRVLNFVNNYSAPLAVPSNLSGDPVSSLLVELQDESNLLTCYQSGQLGSDLDRCIATIAVEIVRPDLCNLIPARRDRCLVSLVPLTKDPLLCPKITSPSFKDDCYIELAGAYKNSTYCSDITESNKTASCLNASSVNGSR